MLSCPGRVRAERAELLRGRGALGRRGISTVLDFVMLTVVSISWALVLVCAMFHALKRWL